MTASARRPVIEDPSWVLDPITEVKGVKHALILSSDGMIIGASEKLSREEAEGTSAMTAALQGAARSAANTALGAPEDTPVGTITVQNAYGNYMIMPVVVKNGAKNGAKTNTFIAAAGSLDWPMGVVAHAMARQAKKLGEQMMSVPARATDDTAS